MSPKRPKLLVTRSLPLAVEERLARTYDCTLDRNDRKIPPSDLFAALRQFDIVCSNPGDVFDATMFSGETVYTKLLANFGAGVDHIDLAAATTAGMTVTNTPDAVTEPTADLAMLLILMVSRRAGEGERQLRSGCWDGWRPMHLLGRDIAGSTIGLVGFGRIGRATARRARAFGMRVAYTARHRSPEAETETGAQFVPDLATMASVCDVLSVHCPGGSATHHLIDEAIIAAMKPSAILINTARGTVVDEAALVWALEAGAIAGAGLDVYEREPGISSGLLAREDVVLLPHLGTATAGARISMGMQMADNIDAFVAGNEPPNIVNAAR